MYFCISFTLESKGVRGVKINMYFLTIVRGLWHSK